MGGAQSCPWVGLGRVGSRFFLDFGGLGCAGSTVAKVLQICKDYDNAFKARSDEKRHYQSVSSVVSWVGSGHRKWTH